MRFNNGATLNKPPLLFTPFQQHWIDAGINPPPPGTDLRITDAGENRTTDGGDYRITD